LLALVEPTRKEVGCINYDVGPGGLGPVLIDLSLSLTIDNLGVPAVRLQSIYSKPLALAVQRSGRRVHKNMAMLVGLNTVFISLTSWPAAYDNDAEELSHNLCATVVHL
jgi:hypothetical protein